MKHVCAKRPAGALEAAIRELIPTVSIPVLHLSACMPAQASVQQKTVLIGSLEKAVALDSADAADDKTDAVQAIDSIYQARKAHWVIQRLRRGEALSQVQIDDALALPPQSLSMEARIEMIKELKAAEAQDELGEQTHDPGNDWLAWDSYRQQRDRAQEISEALEAGADVRWSEIQNALQVPKFQ